MSICTITAENKDVYFAKHRYVKNEYGEYLPKNDNAAYCPTRIEVNYDAKTLVIKTKTHGTASYVFSDTVHLPRPYPKKDAVGFIDVRNEYKLIGGMFFTDSYYSDFSSLVIFRKDDTELHYYED